MSVRVLLDAGARASAKNDLDDTPVQLRMAILDK